MSEVKAKGLSKPVKLKKELAELLGAKEMPRTEITKKLWDYIKANKLQTQEENGAATGLGRFIVADAKLLPLFQAEAKFAKMKQGQTINMMQMASVVSANVE